MNFSSTLVGFKLEVEASSLAATILVSSLSCIDFLSELFCSASHSLSEMVIEWTTFFSTEGS
nr:unknown [Medicago truncatula]